MRYIWREKTKSERKKEEKGVDSTHFGRPQVFASRERQQQTEQHICTAKQQNTLKWGAQTQIHFITNESYLGFWVFIVEMRCYSAFDALVRKLLYSNPVEWRIIFEQWHRAAQNASYAHV